MSFWDDVNDAAGKGGLGPGEDAGTAGIASTLARYLGDLMVAGFTRKEAVLLVESFQRCLFDMARNQR